MDTVLVPWWLLIIGASLCSGHYIRQAENGHSNVYKVRESPSGVSFTNPTPDKPTLREILYYHVIERARDREPTERSFTNGHGYQFLEQKPSNEQDLYDAKDDGQYRPYEHEGQGVDENENDGHYKNKDDENDGHYENKDNENDGHYIKEDNENDGHFEHEDNDLVYSDEDPTAILKELLSGHPGDEEDPELTTTQKPLTDEDVKEAYKTRSYLFDQLRQRYAVKRMAVPDTLKRRKRQADLEPIPDAPKLSTDISLTDAYMQPKTYGMNLNPEGGYVWNNLNKPPTYYELGNGNPNEGQYESSQSQGNIPQPTEPVYIPPAQSQEYIPPTIETPAPETSDSGSSEDIFVNTYRPNAPLETKESLNENPAPVNENPEPINEYPEPIANPVPIIENQEPFNEYPAPNANLEPIKENSELSNEYPAPIANPEPIIENPEPINEYPAPITNPEPIIENPEPVNDPVPNDSGANYPVAPVIADDVKSDSDGVANYPMGPEVYNPEQILGPIEENPSQIASGEGLEKPISEGPVEPVGSYENPEMSYEPTQPEEAKPESSPEEISEADKIKEIPEAPTLPPLNYDNLPSYIRDAISSTEKPASYEQTENSYFNPQTSSEDKKVMEDKMEDIFATMTPVDDIPKTYGMNLTSDGGHVWNDMVNPPISYDIGSPSKPEEESKEPNLEPEVNQPDIHESEEAKIPVEEPAKPGNEEIEEPIAKPDEVTIQQPGPYESEDSKSPIEEPAKPEKKDIDEPIVKPDEVDIEQPELYESEEPQNPITVPAEPEKVGEKDETITNPVEPNQQQPESHESEETKNPIEEPAGPVKEDDIREPIADPNQQGQEPVNEPNPEILVNPYNKPIDEPNEQLEPLKPEPENQETEKEDHPEIEESDKPADSEEPSEDNEQEEPAEINPEEEKKPDIMSELLKSEQFWKWLGEWTATYMELLEKHIRKIAIQEICNREKAGSQMCLLGENPENADTGVVVKDGKIVVNGKEIEMTHTDNLNKDLKRGNHNNNKADKGNKIEASTIYGNSVGNEHVTNVFIFTADKAEEVIDKLKPENDSEVDFVIDDRIKEDTTEKPLEALSAGDTDTKPIESGTSKDESHKEELDKVEDKENKEENIENPKKESAGDTDTNPIESGTSKDELNKEESDKVEDKDNKEENVENPKKESAGDTDTKPIESGTSKDELNKEESDKVKDKENKEENIENPKKESAGDTDTKPIESGTSKDESQKEKLDKVEDKENKEGNIENPKKESAGDTDTKPIESSTSKDELNKEESDKVIDKENKEENIENPKKESAGDTNNPIESDASRDDLGIEEEKQDEDKESRGNSDELEASADEDAKTESKPEISENTSALNEYLEK